MRPRELARGRRRAAGVLSLTRCSGRMHCVGRGRLSVVAPKSFPALKSFRERPPSPRPPLASRLPALLPSLLPLLPLPANAGMPAPGDEQELLALDATALAARAADGVVDGGVVHGGGAAGGAGQPFSVLRRLTPRSERLLRWAGLDSDIGGDGAASGGGAGPHGAAAEEEASRAQWRRAARLTGLAYICLHLLAATVQNVRRAAPALLCALAAAAWHASRKPTVIAKLHMYFVAANRFALERSAPYTLGILELSQLALVAASALVLVVALVRNLERSVAVAGMVACVLCALLQCPVARRRYICWRRTVAPGLAVQLVLGYAILATQTGQEMFLAMGRSAEDFLEFSYVGSDFVFTAELSSKVFVAFRMLPTIVFFSTISSLLFYLGLVQIIVEVLGAAMQHLMHTSRLESVCAAGNIFLGQSEAPLLIAPLLPTATPSGIAPLLPPDIPSGLSQH